MFDSAAVIVDDSLLLLGVAEVRVLLEKNLFIGANDDPRM
jgi:hypothetical protein